MLEAEHIEIVTQDNRILPATAVAYDIATGFGLVRPLLPLRGVAPVTLGSVRDLKPGEPLMAATGSSGGTNGDDGGVSMTQLVNTRAFSGTWEYHLDGHLHQPACRVNRGNHSGAPLFNHGGELVGVGSLLVMDAAGENRTTPAACLCPVDLLKPILAEMRQSGSTSSQSRRPWLGLTSSDRDGKVQIDASPLTAPQKQRA